MYKNKKRCVVFDVETTGFSPQHGARIIEIGGVLVENGNIVSEFQSLVNCGKAVSRQAQMVHGISDRMLFGQPAPEEVFPLFHRFISGCTLVAHNAAFDISFLRHELSRLGLGMNNGSLCTIKMSRRCFPLLPNHKLDTVAKHILGVLPPGIHRHRALDDARLTAMIWMEMVKIGRLRVDDLVKSQISDGKVKSSSSMRRESSVMRHTYRTPQSQRDEAQRRHEVKLQR